MMSVVSGCVPYGVVPPSRPNSGSFMFCSEYLQSLSVYVPLTPDESSNASAYYHNPAMMGRGRYTTPSLLLGYLTNPLQLSS